MLHNDTSRYKVREWKAEQALGRFNPAGDCMAPIGVHAKGAPDPHLVATSIEKDKPAFVKYDIRCRRCEACLRHRMRLWTARAMDETRVSSRTWFGTLTVAPAHRFSAIMKADLAQHASKGRPWLSLSDAEQFQKICDQLQPEVTRFLKRVRKNKRFRYLLVSEEHKDGFPHFHMLLHEVGINITKRELDSQWALGFSQWRLVDGNDMRQVSYVCKYLSKSALTRVRASLRYGRGPILAARATEMLSVETEAAEAALENIAVSQVTKNVRKHLL